jgi:hypothetical protein
MAQSPIFNKTHDFLHWLIPLTLKFPRQQRGVLSKRLQDCAFELQVELVMAAALDDPLPVLSEVDIKLTLLRHYLRLAKEWELMSIRQYEHASRMVDEIGRLLGGWQQSCLKKAGAVKRKPGPGG